MIVAAKFLTLPTLAVWGLLGTAKVPGAGSFAGLIAVAIILGGVFMFGRLKTRADEAERLLTLAQKENDIQETSISRLEKRNSFLESQPNLERHAKLLDKLLAKADEQTELLREIRVATVPPTPK